MEKIKNCPFDNGRPEILYSLSFINSYFIKCKTCAAMTSEFKDADKAIEAWNRRVNE